MSNKNDNFVNDNDIDILTITRHDPSSGTKEIVRMQVAQEEIQDFLYRFFTVDKGVTATPTSSIAKHPQPTSIGRSTIDILSENDFTGVYSYTEEMLVKLNELAAKLPKSEKLGLLEDEKEYLDALNVFMAAGFEREHLIEIIERMITPRLRNCQNMLDIGVGNGKLSKLLGEHCKFFTGIDNKQESLNSLPNKMGSSTINNVEKIKGTVLDMELPNKKFDFIIVSHMLYYIDSDERIKLIDKLYNLLSPKGSILIIYNDSGDREALAEHFNGKRHSFHQTVEHIYKTYKDKYFYQSPEILKANNFDTFKHVMGVVLNDDGTTASETEARQYADSHLKCDVGYCLGMDQNVIIISNYKGIYHTDDFF